MASISTTPYLRAASIIAQASRALRPAASRTARVCRSSCRGCSATHAGRWRGDIDGIDERTAGHLFERGERMRTPLRGKASAVA